MHIYTLLQGKRSILIKKCQKLRKRKTNTKAIILDIVHCYRFKTQMLTFWFLMVTTQWQMLLVHTVKPVGLLVCFVLCCHPSPLSSSLPRPPTVCRGGIIHTLCSCLMQQHSPPTIIEQPIHKHTLLLYTRGRKQPCLHSSASFSISSSNHIAALVFEIKK